MPTLNQTTIEHDVRVARQRLGATATSDDILRWINHHCRRNYTLTQVEAVLREVTNTPLTKGAKA